MAGEGAWAGLDQTPDRGCPKARCQDLYWRVLLPENTRMLHLLRDLGLPERLRYEDGVEYVEIELASQRSE